MAKIDPKQYGSNTNAVRAGQVRSAEGEHSEPIVTTSSFVFKDAAEAAARFSGDAPGNIYSRFTNPTVRTFEERLAAMEVDRAGVSFVKDALAVDRPQHLS